MTSRCSPSTRCATRASRSSPFSPRASAPRARRVAKVKVDYEELPAVFDVEEALKPGAPLVNEYHGQNYFTYEGHHCRRVRHGDVEKAFADGRSRHRGAYQSSPIEHAPTETTGCIVVPDENDRYTCYSNTQALFFTLDNTALILNSPFHKLRLIGGTVGGGFGGKVDVIVEPIAFLAAMLTNRPVKYAYTREEEMQVSSPRAAERIYIKDGVMKDGRIVARKVRLYVDAGAYSRHQPLRHDQGGGAYAGALHDPQCPGRLPLRLYQPHAVLGDARLRRHHRRFRARSADGQARAARRHGSDGVPHPQRLSRRRHEGAWRRRRMARRWSRRVQAAAELADWPLG